jgi:hypothetical protein
MRQLRAPIKLHSQHWTHLQTWNPGVGCRGNDLSHAGSLHAAVFPSPSVDASMPTALSHFNPDDGCSFGLVTELSPGGRSELPGAHGGLVVTPPPNHSTYGLVLTAGAADGQGAGSGGVHELRGRSTAAAADNGRQWLAAARGGVRAVGGGEGHADRQADGGARGGVWVLRQPHHAGAAPRREVRLPWVALRSHWVT